MSPNRNALLPAKAFTLVELLAVLVLLALMSAMVITATNGVTESARQTRTRKIIAAIDSVIQERYRSYKYRPLAIEIPETFNAVDPVNSPNEIGFEVLASEAGRVRLMMIRDLQRMELPDRLSDIGMAPALLRAASNPVVVNATGQIVGTRNDNSTRRMFRVNWYDANATHTNGGDNVPSKLATYRERLRSLENLGGFSFNFSNSVALQNQGAECLYLIMATSYVGGGPALNVIPTSNIGDTDGDGLREILDGWGRPLQFIRWPVGFVDFEQSLVAVSFDPASPGRTPVPDDFDLFRADFAYTVDPSLSTAGVPLNVNITTPLPELKPWSMRPLIFSLGPDGESGIATNPWTDASLPLNQTNEVDDFQYLNATFEWPADANHCGTEWQGRTRGPGTTTYSSHDYPDPYLRRFIELNGGTTGFTGLLPGQIFPTATAAEEVIDNITNYELQANVR